MGLSFEDTSKAFAGKTDSQLSRSKLLFRLMQSPFLVRLLSKLTVGAMRMGLPVSPLLKATVFKQFCGGESINESTQVVKQLEKYKVGSILDYSIEGKQCEEDFEKTKNEVINIIHLASKDPAIPYTSLKLTGVARFDLLEKLSSGSKLDEKGAEELKRTRARIDDICRCSSENNVPIYFDAEESWIQPAIDQVAEEMMRMYNRKEAIVLTTLQMYRWDRLEYLEKLLKEARREKFLLGIKLVRGAYLEKENERASRLGYRSPIHKSKNDTDTDFDKAVELCLRNVDIVVLCAGTHNEASTMYLLHKMKELGIRNDHPHVYFSQLYGMSDHITFNLAAEGYNVTKYLPYGPVKAVLPYLIRRAEENTAIAGQMGRELKLILAEKRRRQEQKLLS